jgi:membrane protease YdiL (CAAX protease family)
MGENLLPSMVQSAEPDPLRYPDQAIFPVWSVWDVVALFFFTGFVALGVGSLGSASWNFLLARFRSIHTLRHPGFEAVSLLIFQALLDILILLFIYVTITLKYAAPFWSSIKWTGKAHKLVLTYLPLGVSLALIVLGVSALLPSPRKPPVEELLQYPVSAFMFAALGVFIAPFVEELIFRGFIYPVVERSLGKIAAVLTTALLFTGLHLGQLWGSWVSVALILLVGTTLSTVRAGTGSLKPSFIIHLSYNCTICLLFLVTSLVKGFPALSG